MGLVVSLLQIGCAGRVMYQIYSLHYLEKDNFRSGLRNTNLAKSLDPTDLLGSAKNFATGMLDNLLKDASTHMYKHLDIQYCYRFYSAADGDYYGTVSHLEGLGWFRLG